MAAVPAEPESELNTGLLLFLPYRALENRIFAVLAEAGFDDFTPAQARVLQRVGPDGTRLTELAEQAQITKQTAGFLVDQLEASGHVTREPDPSDRRARLGVSRGAGACRAARRRRWPRWRRSGRPTSASAVWLNSARRSPC